MKTSNQFLFATIVLTLASLVVYDILLKAAYKSGNYADPYKDFVSLKFKDFDALDLPSSTAANVKVVQGPFSVRMDEGAAEFVQVNQEAKQLIIKAAFDGNYRSVFSEYVLLISCPKLLKISVNASYRANNENVTDTIVREDWNMRKVLVDGFTQDSLHITQDYGSTVVLTNDHIRALSAVVGKSARSGSSLIIKDNNAFINAELDIQNNSRLFLENAKIQNLSYELGDNSKLIISGKAKNLLNKIKPGQK